MRGIPKTIATMLALLAILALAGSALALDKFETDLKVQEAALMVKKFMTSPDKDAPLWFLKHCKAVVIVPNMVKAGFVVGGKYGVGVVLAKTGQGGWSLPSFITIAGGSFGLQIGAQSTDLMLFIMNNKGLKGILKNKLRFGVDAAVTAGPVGRDATAGLTAASLKADVYSYSRSQGAFLGATVDGSAMEVEPAYNQSYYGKKVAVKALLKGQAKLKVPESARKLMATLDKFAK